MFKFILKQPLWAKAAVVAAVLVVAWVMFGRGKVGGSGTTFTSRRGDLVISVLEGGSIEALESQDIKCEVRGYQGVKILKIVEEGYQVTDDDVRTNKVLVELDSSELNKMLVQQQIQFESTVASLTEARQAYDIQLNQNVSDLKAAEQKAKFARMDFEKFMGDAVAHEIIAQLSIDENPPAPEPAAIFTNDTPATATNWISSGSSGSAASKAPLAPAAFPAKKVIIDFASYAKPELLGDGEAKQKIRKLDDELQVAKKSIAQTITKIEGTQRLHEKGFVSKVELQTDEYILENDKLKLATAETALSLFMKYEFLKSAEEGLGKYVEAVNELGRARKAAVSKLAQAEAKVKASEGRYNLEIRQREEITSQIDKCLIRAKKPGLVVYGGSGMMRFYYGNEQIREGALVREQQPIITIPDLTHMSVKVKVHETYVKKIKKGQQARITADAFPDKTLEGEVTKVGVLPDSQNRWVDPDNKVYLTTITISNVTDWLKPGMSAKTEILVKTLPDVVYVPIQAVMPISGKQFCFVESATGQERREVEVGEFNDEFIEIKKGVEAGEKICLRAPPGTEKDTGSKENKPAEPEKPKPATPSQAAAPAPIGKL